ncbi:MAG: hypothetical protein ACYTDU_10440 [Planctomycetota bacterium]|jgi:truncated hemoglobin YjbI
MVRRVFLCLLTAAALAQDPNEEIREARQTLEEFLKIGDELVRQGKHEAALKTYREAAKAYDEAMRKVEEAMLHPPIDPPADLAHLDATPADLRRRIDELVAVMMDPQAGRESLQAQEQLRAIGKAAFPRILGAMAKVLDRITDEDTMEERLLESALKLGDECLRTLDGYLDAKQKTSLRPGVDKNYIHYILRLHYRRWNEKLKDLAEMPGPHQPADEVFRGPIKPASRRVAAEAGKWDPPATLGHVAGTPAEQRKMIDALVQVLFDVQAGRESLNAQQKLAAIGKPAFPVILGRMAKVRDTLTDDDTMEERLAESSLKLADECLRQIDPYLAEKGKVALRPGTDLKYVRYILRLHYRRWVEVVGKGAD